MWQDFISPATERSHGEYASSNRNKTEFWAGSIRLALGRLAVSTLEENSTAIAILTDEPRVCTIQAEVSGKPWICTLVAILSNESLIGAFGTVVTGESLVCTTFTIGARKSRIWAVI